MLSEDNQSCVTYIESRTWLDTWNCVTGHEIRDGMVRQSGQCVVLVTAPSPYHLEARGSYTR